MATQARHHASTGRSRGAPALTERTTLLATVLHPLPWHGCILVSHSRPAVQAIPRLLERKTTSRRRSSGEPRSLGDQILRRPAARSQPFRYQAVRPRVSVEGGGVVQAGDTGRLHAAERAANRAVPSAQAPRFLSLVLLTGRGSTISSARSRGLVRYGSWALSMVAQSWSPPWRKSTRFPTRVRACNANCSTSVDGFRAGRLPDAGCKPWRGPRHRMNTRD